VDGPAKLQAPRSFTPFTTIPRYWLNWWGEGAPPVDAEVTLKVKLGLAPLKNSSHPEIFPMIDGDTHPTWFRGCIIPEGSAGLEGSRIEIYPEFHFYRSRRRCYKLAAAQPYFDAASNERISVFGVTVVMSYDWLPGQSIQARKWFAD